jgi:hypothetical protein
VNQLEIPLMALPRQSWEVLRALCLLASSATLWACQGGEGSRGGGGAGSGSMDGTGKAWIIGIWEGTYENLNASVDSEQRETSAWLEFKATSERAGKFHLKLPQMDDVYAKGSFTDIDNFRLIFKIEDSNLSSMGMAETSRTFDYELANDSLMLRNVRIQMTLARKGGGGSSGDASLGGDRGDDAAEYPLGGSWYGTDQRGRTWLIKIFGMTRFTIEVTEPEKAMLWMSGVPRFDEATAVHDATLVVGESAIGEYVGMEYAVRLIDGGSLELRRLGRREADGAQPNLETFVCTKQE